MFPPGSPPLPDLLTELWQPRIWAFVVALLVSLLATPLFRWVAYRMGIYDRPDDAVKIHRRPVPYLGGCAVWLAWTSGLVMNHLLFHPSYASAGIALAAGGALAFGFIGVFLGPTLLAVGYSLAHEILTDRRSALAPEPACESQKSSAEKTVGADEKN